MKEVDVHHLSGELDCLGGRTVELLAKLLLEGGRGLVRALVEPHVEIVENLECPDPLARGEERSVATEALVDPQLGGRVHRGRSPGLVNETRGYLHHSDALQAVIFV